MNKVKTYSLVIIFAVFISSVSQILLKISAMEEYESKLKEYLNPMVIIGYSLFFGCTLINMLALKYVPLSMAPILESFGYIFVSVLGRLILKEKIGRKMLVGMIIIIAGVFIYSV